MAKKRGNNEGSISKRKDGRWRADISLGNNPATGKPIRKTFYAKTRKEVADKLKQAIKDHEQGRNISTDNQTVADWFTKWVEIYAKPRVRQTTYESYECNIRIHIIPALGAIKLKDLRPEHLQNLYTEKLENGRVDGKGGLSSTSVRYIHKLIKQGLNQALLDQIVFRNIAANVSAPKKSRHEITLFSVEQMNQLLHQAKGSRIFTALLVEWATGLRRGELLGLRWQDVDLTKGIVSVRQSLINTRLKGLIYEEPKTAKSKRPIPLPKEVALQLRIHKKQQLEEVLMFGADYFKNDLVFCNPDDRPYDPKWFVTLFKRILEEAGLPDNSFRNMRHSHATMLLLLNEHPKVVSERLGHSTIAMTLDTYSHVIPGMQERASEKLSGVLDLKKEPSR
ncbi:MAG: site-specific integrase [Alkaliphilus sp.]|nr:MAG: site-specific integrase [Alkaliphilus sp.]